MIHLPSVLHPAVPIPGRAQGCEAATGGVGLVLLPCYVGAAVPGLAQLTPPLPDLESELWLITHPDLRNTARVRAFLDFCADEIARQRDTLEGAAPATTVRYSEGR